MSESFRLPEHGGFGSDDFLRRQEKIAADAASSVFEKEHPDAALVAETVSILKSVARLMPSIQRLKEIVEDANHPLLNSQHAAVSPEMKLHMQLMRKAQVGGLIHLMRVIKKTSDTTIKEVPAIHAAAKKNAVDRALNELGISDAGNEHNT